MDRIRRVHLKKKFQPGDKAIVLSGFYKDTLVEVLSYWASSGKVHVLGPNYSFSITEDFLEFAAIVESPLYKALS